MRKELPSSPVVALKEEYRIDLYSAYLEASGPAQRKSNSVTQSEQPVNWGEVEMRMLNRVRLGSHLLSSSCRILLAFGQSVPNCRFSVLESDFAIGR